MLFFICFTDSCFNYSFFKVCDPVMGDAGKFVSHVKFLCLLLILLLFYFFNIVITYL